MDLVTMTFDRLNFKLVCKSHLRWGTFFPNLGTLGLWVLELFAMYATDGQTDGRMDGQKQRLLHPYLQSGDNNYLIYLTIAYSGGCQASLTGLLMLQLDNTEPLDREALREIAASTEIRKELGSLQRQHGERPSYDIVHCMPV